MTPKLELRSLICILEIHKLLVSFGIYIRRPLSERQEARISYFRTEDRWTKIQKLDFLNERQHMGRIHWQSIKPDKRQIWLTEGLHDEFEFYVPLGTESAKDGKEGAEGVIFQSYSTGVLTGRDAWVYNFNPNDLAKNIEFMISNYNDQVFKWERQRNRDTNVDDFVISNDTKISWSATLKNHLKGGKIAEFTGCNIRHSHFRPFTLSCLYFDRMVVDRVSGFPSIFPTTESEVENRVIWLKVGAAWPMFALVVNKIPNRLPQSGSQCFPFYIYDEDGSNRCENITDWALAQFRSHYCDDKIGKWDIFHYVYGLLHHPSYRDRYQANLQHELPRIPFAPDFRAFASAGSHLATLHVNYSEQPEYRLDRLETPGKPLDWRVKKMEFSKDGTQLRYNDFLTLDGIPAQALSYQLGTRSALEWVIDQYSVRTNGPSGIANNPNRAEDPQYILRLIGQVITVSLETVKIVENLPDLGIES